jgi:hypothetical protein
MKTKTKSVTKHYSTIFTIVILAINSISAQEASKHHSALYGGFGYFGFAGEQHNLAEFNKSLSAVGYKEISIYNTSFGGGGNFIIHNFLIGGHGAWISGNRTENANNYLNIQGGYGLFNLGYVVFSDIKSVLYPEIGLGGGGFDITISEKNINTDFENQLRRPTNMTTITTGGLLINTSFGYLRFFNKASKEGLSIGLKLGYKFNPNEWMSGIDQTTMINTPKFNMSGFYASIIIGGGGIVNLSTAPN